MVGVELRIQGPAQRDRSGTAAPVLHLGATRTCRAGIAHGHPLLSGCFRRTSPRLRAGRDPRRHAVVQAKRAAAAGFGATVQDDLHFRDDRCPQAGVADGARAMGGCAIPLRGAGAAARRRASGRHAASDLLAAARASELALGQRELRGRGRRTRAGARSPDRRRCAGAGPRRPRFRRARGLSRRVCAGRPLALFL